MAMTEPAPSEGRPDGESPSGCPATRTRILDAAMTEFGARGYAGARTAAIAARAGVNQQLISYYFGGKLGLFNALREQWTQGERRRGNSSSFAESLLGYLEVTAHHPDWARLAVWTGLESSGDDVRAPAADDARTRAGLERVRAWQADGQIRADVDPRVVALLVYAVSFAPAALPAVVGTLFGTDAADDAVGYRDACATTLLAALAPPPPARPQQAADATHPSTEEHR